MTPASSKATPQAGAPGKPAPVGPAPRRAKARPSAPRRRRATGRGALTLIAVLFALAGAIRLGVGMGEAVERSDAGAHDAAPASESAHAPADAMADGKPAAHAPPTQGAKAGTGACPDGGLAMPLVEALRAREARVKALEAALEDRRQALAVAEKIVAAKLAELKAAEAKLAKTIAIADTAAEKDVARLTEVYAAMKPKQASAVFEKMAPDFAAGFLGRMPPASAAAILSGMTPEKAYTVSVILAGRNAAAPRN